MVLSMLKLNLVLALLFLNISAYAADYYVNSNSSFPEPQVVTKVYMGDKMLEQRYVYSEQCYIPKNTFSLEQNVGSDMTICYTSTKSIKEKCCAGTAFRTIAQGGTMCGSSIREMRPMNYFSVISANGNERTKTFSHSIKNKKGKVTISQVPGGAKVIKMTDTEFEDTFKRSDNYWKVSLNFRKEVSVCKSLKDQYSGIFDGVNSSLVKILPTETMTGRVSSVSVNPAASGVNITANHSQGSSTWNLSEEEFNNSFEETSKVIEVEAGMQRTIEYAGINGNLVKFIYSEFKDGMARDAFTREFTIDLSGDSIAAYKGAVFEVIKATNSTIEYKVIRNFPVET